MIGMADSIHVARWIDQFEDSGLEFDIFPSSPHRRIHRKIEQRTNTGSNPSVRIVGLGMRHLALPFAALDILCRNRIRGLLLRRVLKSTRYDLIHIQELQHAGYVYLASGFERGETPLYITNWGSDVYWFGRFRSHRRRLERLISDADFYSCECRRDAELISDLGFSGEVVSVLPNAGGIRAEELDSPRSESSTRKRVLIKGYTGFVGRSHWVLWMLPHLKSELRHTPITVYSASRKARLISYFLRLVHKIDISCMTPGVSHSEMLRLFRDSRCYIGWSLSDGISTSLLEAMASGTFPIQTNTSCADEWIRDGVTGFILDPYDRQGFVRSLRRVLTDDELVDSAAVTNHALIRRKSNFEVIRNQNRKIYDRLISTGHSHA